MKTENDEDQTNKTSDGDKAKTVGIKSEDVTNDEKRNEELEEYKKDQID